MLDLACWYCGARLRHCEYVACTTCRVLDDEPARASAAVRYHVTTPRKLARYETTGCILSPVRFWTTLYSAQRWARKTGRSVILAIDPPREYPLPIKGGAAWCDVPVREWTEVVP